MWKVGLGDRVYIILLDIVICDIDILIYSFLVL